MSIDRRNFLKQTGALSMAAGASSLGWLNVNRAHAANLGGYKALVCVFLYGGMDHADTIFPYDQADYDQLQETRSSLFSSYGVGRLSDASRDRDNLLRLNVQNAEQFNGRQFAMPRELGPIRNLFNTGDAAIVGGVGPLVEPTNRANFEARSVQVPSRLFSHNDQQSTWMSLDTEGAKIGWGGRFADAIKASGPVGMGDYSTVSAAGTTVFLAGTETQQYGISTQGPFDREVFTKSFVQSRVHQSARLTALMRDHAAATGVTSSNLYMQDIAAMRARGELANQRFDTFWQTRSPLNIVFPATRIGQQLKTVAESIALQSQLNAPRQVFFTALGGFDTHSDQATRLPVLHTDLAEAIDAFTRALQDIGMMDDVTLFTASDFGRGLLDNGNGTDHGWAGHQLVVGGAVKGGRIYGEMAAPDPLGSRYTTNGSRLIPAVSVEQYAATLGGWFGLNQAELNTALPRLQTFSSPNLGFL